MGIWLICLSISIVLCLTSFVPKNRVLQRSSFFLLNLWLVYFSAFREGLGKDYYGYKIRLEQYVSLSFLDEPSFTLMSYIIKTTSFSYVFYFLISAVLTIPLILYCYKKYEYSYFTILLFIVSTGIGYFQTFNAVRQSIAIALFFYGCLFLLEKRFFCYATCIVIGFLFHKSCILLLPLYFFLSKTISPKILISSIWISLILGWGVSGVDLSFIGNTQFEYSSMLVEDVNKSESSMFFVYSIILTVLLGLQLASKKHRTDKYNLVINSSVLCVIFFNMLTLGSAFSRFGLYFGVFLPLGIVYLLKQFKQYRMLQHLYLIAHIVLFIYTLVINKENNLIVPNKINNISTILK